jgi:hypothetical protein
MLFGCSCICLCQSQQYIAASTKHSVRSKQLYLVYSSVNSWRDLLLTLLLLCRMHACMACVRIVAINIVVGTTQLLADTHKTERCLTNHW